MKIRYSLQAAGDLQHIEEYYEARVGSKVAQDLMLRLKSTLETVVARNPHIGRLRVELGKDIRSFPVLPYVVFYRVEARTILVERILHGHRDIRGAITSLLLAG